MNDTAVRRVVRDKIADGSLPETASARSELLTELTKYATCAPSQSRLKKCCIRLPVRAHAHSYSLLQRY
jgi:hypothetical protein